MALLNLQEMAKYGAYGAFFNGMSSWSRREDSSWGQSKGNTYLKPFKFIGNNANFEVPLPPVEPIEAQRLKRVAEASSIDAQFAQTNFSFGLINDNYYTTKLDFTSRPSTFTVNMEEDTVSPVEAKTNKGEGGVFSKDATIVGKLEFTFQPGAVQTLSYDVTSGVDMSTAVTEGISNTTSSGGSSSTTLAAELGGSFLGFEIGGSLSQEWTSNWGQSQTIDYSKSDTKTISRSETIQVSVDLGQLIPDANGKYYYGDTELIPGQRYQILVKETKESMRVPVTGLMNLSGDNLTFAGKTSMPSNYNNKGDFSYSITKNIAEYILDANKLNYDALYQGDLSQRTWNLETNPLMLQMGIVAEGRFSGASGLSIDVKPVASPIVKFTALSSEQATKQLASIEPVYISLDDYNLQDNVVGVAINLADFGESLLTAYSVLGTTGGGDMVTLDGHPTELYGFRDSTFQVNAGENFFFNTGEEENNTYFLDGGNNTLYLLANEHYVASHGGQNLIVVGGGENLYIDNGQGSDVLKIKTTLNNIVVENWDFNADILQFGGKVNLSDVLVKYDQGMTEYKIFIQDFLVAILDADDANLPEFDPVSRTFQGTEVVPFALNSASTTSFLGSLYSAAFDRAPDAAGMNYWATAIVDGADRKSIVESFFSSPEYNLLYDSNETFVAGLYRDILGRSPDVAGETYWVRDLELGASRTNVIQGFITSSEFNAFFS